MVKQFANFLNFWVLNEVQVPERMQTDAYIYLINKLNS